MDRYVIACAEALARLEHFDAVIDVRSESEFAEDRIPGALNCPVLDDEQRALVGTQYKRQSPFAARRHGAALVARNIAHHLETVFADKPRDWKPLVYCWRGGQRSGAMTHVLARVGWHARQLEGGYRAYRRAVVQALAELPARVEYRVICGTTGSGKSRLLRALARVGAQVLDLEDLAQHRGSVLGGLPLRPQPSQKQFETRIWWQLRGFDAQRPVFVESESRKVGDLRVPDALIERMRTSTCLRLEVPFEARIALLRDEYLHLERDRDTLQRQLDCLAPLHGRERVDDWKRLAERGDWPQLVERLLREHYDPVYLKSIGRNFTRAADAAVIAPAGLSDDDFAQLARAIST